MLHNKRRHKRFDVSTVVEIKSLKAPANFCLGVIKNFSFEGFSFQSQSKNLEVGEDIEFKFRHPQFSSDVFYAGKIVWKQRDNKFNCLMGVKFKEIDKAAKSKMLAIVSFAGNIPVDSFLSDKCDKDIHVEENEATNHEFLVDEPETTGRVEEVEAAYDETFELDREEVNDTVLQMDSGQAIYDDTSLIKKDQRKKIWLYLPIAIAIVVTLFVIFENSDKIFKSPIPVPTKSVPHEDIDKKDSIPIVVDAQTGDIEKDENELKIANMKNELESEKNWIKSFAVNVRESNSISSRVIDKLRRGDYVFIQEENNNWYRVYYSEPNDARRFNSISELIAAYKKGWIYKNLLSSIRIDRLSVGQKHPVPIDVEGQVGNIEYYIQVGSWKNPNYAQEMLVKLKRYYPEAYITVVNNFHTIRIPEIMNKKQGADISKDIEKKLNLKPIVVRKM